MSSIRTIEIVSVARVVSERLCSVSIENRPDRLRTLFEMTGAIRTTIWKPGFTLLHSVTPPFSLESGQQIQRKGLERGNGEYQGGVGEVERRKGMSRSF